MIFVGQTKLRIELETGTSLANVSSTQIAYINPNKQQGAWTATVDGTKVFYDVVSGDLNIAGEWRIWSVVTFADNKVGIGEATRMIVKKQGDI
jgi:hypothetical protein